MGANFVKMNLLVQSVKLDGPFPLENAFVLMVSFITLILKLVTLVIEAAKNALKTPLQLAYLFAANVTPAGL